MTGSLKYKPGILNFSSQLKCQKQSWPIHLAIRAEIWYFPEDSPSLEIIPKCCRALREKHFLNGKFIVLDYESYFTFLHHELSGNDRYYTDNFKTTPDNVKYARKTKFEPKVLVWLAIASKGISALVIRLIIHKSDQCRHLYRTMLAEIEAIHRKKAYWSRNYVYVPPARKVVFPL